MYTVTKMTVRPNSEEGAGSIEEIVESIGPMGEFDSVQAAKALARELLASYHTDRIEEVESDDPGRQYFYNEWCLRHWAEGETLDTVIIEEIA